MDNSIDKMYDNLLKTGEDISKNGLTSESLSKIESLKNELNNAPIYFDQQKDPNLSDINIDKNNKNNETAVVMQSYNPSNGEVIPVESESVEKITNQQFENFISSDNVSDVKNKVMKTNDNLSDMDAIKISNLIIRRKNGESSGFYDELPTSLKRVVGQISMSTNTSNIKGVNIKSKNSIACMIIDEIINNIDNSPELAFDLDTMLAGFDKDMESIKNEMSIEMSKMFNEFDMDRKASIDAAIKRCKENGKEDAVKQLELVKNSIDDAYNLNNFKEFCKTCKIKNFETKKTSRVFDPFNAKYENHKNVINDIKTCPDILDRHLKNNNHTHNVMICLAFCKYCSNMSPDNMSEHSFMYYFIRNIILIDRMNPKGMLYESMDEKAKEFYDGFVSNLYECSSNLLIRNTTF